jgi:hypothetical protein
MIIGVCFCLRRLGVSIIAFLGFWRMVWVVAFGVGLSLNSLWSISVAPVRGGTYFSLPAAKKSRQKKAAHTANS